MPVGLLLAVAAALCRGGAAVLQSVGAARVTQFPGVDLRLFLVLLRSRFYLAGLALDGVSFLLSVIALRSAALFLVQAIGSASLVVVAVLGATLLRERLPRTEEMAVVAVVLGVGMLALSAHADLSATVSMLGEWAILVAAVIVGVVAFGFARRTSGPFLASLLAGFAYGDAAVASRILGASERSFGLLLTNPLSYAVVLGSVLGTLLYATALQHGSVTLASGMTTVGQTLAPGVVGWLLLGDTFRRGLGPVAVAGFLLTSVGALGLARHGGGAVGLRRRHSRAKA
jgi:drug/metabolite transporter (DMT)-like permease